MANGKIEENNLISNIKKIFSPFVKTVDSSLLFEFKRHYEDSQEFVRASIYWMVRSDVVDDLVQEVYLKAWKNFNKFEGRSSFKTWIYRIAKNITYDYLKKEQNQFEELNEESLGHQDELDFPDLITKGLMKLTIKKREVFILYYKLGHTTNEIAELLEISEGTVKSRLHTARDEFIVFLEENGVRHEG